MDENLGASAGEALPKLPKESAKTLLGGADTPGAAIAQAPHGFWQSFAQDAWILSLARPHELEALLAVYRERLYFVDGYDARTVFIIERLMRTWLAADRHTAGIH